ncbi:MAG: hypothetical protein G01um101466_604 [Parcubacteria group bacterium Gr01-1014_66]|nr:MAG: hypothetical protein G01um101466_604 [Parcubacteria group bacterium Gr01-1014_66]
MNYRFRFDAHRKISEVLLRLGLAGTYIFSGYDLFMHPRSWTQFVPYWFSQLLTLLMPLDLFIRMQGIGELILALLFLAWFLPRSFVKMAALISSLEFAGILLFFGIDLITFRDIGLLGASLALFFFIPANKNQ